MKKIVVYILLTFYIFMFISSIFALQVERFDDHIKDENIREAYIRLRMLEITISGLTIFFFFLKKEKLSLFFRIIFIGIILLDILNYK